MSDCLSPRPNQEVLLPDRMLSVLAMTQGKLVGLTNLLRSGEAFIEDRTDRVYLTYSMEIRDLAFSYTWRRKKLK